MRISDWSSDVCSSDLRLGIIASFSYEQTNNHVNVLGGDNRGNWAFAGGRRDIATVPTNYYAPEYRYITDRDRYRRRWGASLGVNFRPTDELEVSAQYFHSDRSEEHTSELQSLMRISYAVFCLKKKTQIHYQL